MIEESENMIVKVDLYEANILLDIPDNLSFLLPDYSVEKNVENAVDIKVFYESETAFFLMRVNNNIVRETCTTEQAAFKLSVEMEQIFCEKIERSFPESILFHGGLLSIKGSSLMILGGKGVGKSTLISLLTEENNVTYHSDDIVAMVNKELFGIPIPQRLRYVVEKNKKNIIGHGIDFSGQIRMFSRPSNVSINKVMCNTVIIPCYNTEVNECKELIGYEKLMCLTENIKSIRGIKDVYLKVGQMSKEIKAYKLLYKDNDWAINKISNLLRM